MSQVKINMRAVEATFESIFTEVITVGSGVAAFLCFLKAYDVYCLFPPTIPKEEITSVIWWCIGGVIIAAFCGFMVLAKYFSSDEDE